jgi:hypothetical protein
LAPPTTTLCPPSFEAEFLPAALGEPRLKEFGHTDPILQVLFRELLGIPDSLQIGMDLSRSVRPTTVIREC